MEKMCLVELTHWMDLVVFCRVIIQDALPYEECVTEGLECLRDSRMMPLQDY